jgi:hypothetical protein
VGLIAGAVSAVAYWAIKRKPKPRPKQKKGALSAAQVAVKDFDDAFYEYAMKPSAGPRSDAKAAFKAALGEGVSENRLVNLAGDMTYEMDYSDKSGDPLAVTKSQMWDLESYRR